MASIYGIQILQNLISAGGAYDAPPDPIVGWGGGYPSPLTTLTNHPLNAFVVLFSKPWLGACGSEKQTPEVDP